MKILVAIEGSQFSDKALLWAMELAKKTGSQVTALTVSEDFNHFEEIFPGMVDVVKDRLAGQAQETIKHAMQLADDNGFAIKTAVSSGTTPYDGILDFARTENVDLIVVGSRGRQGLNRFVMGSVASRVVRHATCSVTVVR